MRSGARVSFVVVSWNTRDLVLRCLTELLPQARSLDGEILLVDNASRDGTAEAVARALPEVQILRNAENLGFSRAANQGIRESRGSVVALLNSDVLIGEVDLQTALRTVEIDPTVGALGCALDDDTGSAWTYDNRFPTPIRIGFEGILPAALAPARFHLRPAGPALSEVDWLAGACLFLRRDALREVGLLDEQFFLYKEDVDLCLRLKHAGYRTVLCREVRLTHLVAQSTRQNPGLESDRAHVEGYRSSAHYARKHFGPTIGTIVVGSLRAGLLLRLVKASLAHLAFGRERDRKKKTWMWRAFRTLDRAPIECQPRPEQDAWKELA